MIISTVLEIDSATAAKYVYHRVTQSFKRRLSNVETDLFCFIFANMEKEQYRPVIRFRCLDGKPNGEINAKLHVACRL